MNVFLICVGYLCAVALCWAVLVFLYVAGGVPAVLGLFAVALAVTAWPQGTKR